MEQQALVPRREVWEFGLLPLQSMLPSLDTGSLLALHARILAASNASPERYLNSSDISRVLDIHPSQAEALLAILDSISMHGPSDASPSPDAAPLDYESSIKVSPHELSMFLLAQLFSKEAHRTDAANEAWPSLAPQQQQQPSGLFSALGMEGMSPNSSLELLSPTRRDSQPSFLNQSLRLSSSSSGAKSLLRQQLQQHIKTQVNALRGYGEFLRRHLDLILDLVRNPSSPSASSPSPSSGIIATGCPLTADEVDRLGFLFSPQPDPSFSSSTSSSSSPSVRISSLVPSFFIPTTTTQQQVQVQGQVRALPVDVILSGLKQTWHEETLDSPRLANLASSFSSSPSPRAVRSLGLAGPSSNGAQVDESRINGVFKGTVVRGESDFPPPTSQLSSASSLRIMDCHDATVYVLAPLHHVLVSGCSDCTIVVGAMGGILRVDRCDKVTVIAAGRRVVASSCHDCTLHLGVSHRPILMGDNRFLRLAPYNTKYERQAAHLSSLGISLPAPQAPPGPVSWNKWDQPIVFVARERKGSGNGSSSTDSPRSHSAGGSIMDSLGGVRQGSLSSTLRHNFSLLPPDEFLPFVIPFTGGTGSLAGGPAHPNTTRWSSYGSGLASSKPLPAPYLFPLPLEYEQSLLKKLGMTAELRNRFKQACLGKEKEKELNDAIQAHFREWLQASGHLRQIYDLSNLERGGEGDLGASLTKGLEGVRQDNAKGPNSCP